MSAGPRELASAVWAAERPVFVTGAGLSVASGLPAYRTGADAVWARFVLEWGTRARLMADPLAWWQTFWLKTHADVPDDLRPNPGHEAIAAMCELHPRAAVITQNVDGLHAASGVPDGRLFEVHGRASRAICTASGCEGWVHPRPSPPLGPVRAGRVPRCPVCGAPERPLVLLFDEHYDAHPWFRGPEAFAALSTADALVFVGTSFAVGITELALEAARDGRIPAYSVNTARFDALHPQARRFAGVVADVIGRAEEVLPAAVAALDDRGA